MLQKDGEDSSAVHAEVMQVVRAHFRPEFLNRIDEIICFIACAARIWGRSSRFSSNVWRSCSRDRKITLELTTEARAWLAEKGYDQPMARGR